jgi:hypothetical protein
MDFSYLDLILMNGLLHQQNTSVRANVGGSVKSVGQLWELPPKIHAREQDGKVVW